MSQINVEYLRDGHYWRGRCYRELNKYEKALEDYDKAIEIDPSYQDAIKNRKSLLKEHPELKC